MSRVSDVYVELSEHARQANLWNAHIFISIHVNAGGVMVLKAIDM